jgi:hypothetical protein
MHLSAVQDHGSTIGIGFKRRFFWPGMALMLCDPQGSVSLIWKYTLVTPLVFLPEGLIAKGTLPTSLVRNWELFPICLRPSSVLWPPEKFQTRLSKKQSRLPPR